MSKKAKYGVLTDKFDNYNLSNANFCNFFDSIPQILRIKAIHEPEILGNRNINFN